MPGKILHHYEKSSLSTIIFVKSREKYRLAIDLSDHQTIRLFSVQWERIEEGSLSEWEKRTKTRICQDRGNNKRSTDWWTVTTVEFLE